MGDPDCSSAAQNGTAKLSSDAQSTGPTIEPDVGHDQEQTSRELRGSGGEEDQSSETANSDQRTPHPPANHLAGVRKPPNSTTLAPTGHPLPAERSLPNMSGQISSSVQKLIFEEPERSSSLRTSRLSGHDHPDGKQLKVPTAISVGSGTSDSDDDYLYMKHTFKPAPGYKAVITGDAINDVYTRPPTPYPQRHDQSTDSDSSSDKTATKSEPDSRDMPGGTACSGQRLASLLPRSPQGQPEQSSIGWSMQFSPDTAVSADGNRSAQGFPGQNCSYSDQQSSCTAANGCSCALGCSGGSESCDCHQQHCTRHRISSLGTDIPHVIPPFQQDTRRPLDVCPTLSVAPQSKLPSVAAVTENISADARKATKESEELHSDSGKERPEPEAATGVTQPWPRCTTRTLLFQLQVAKRLPTGIEAGDCRAAEKPQPNRLPWPRERPFLGVDPSNAGQCNRYV
jgi:hypothetical protein